MEEDVKKTGTEDPGVDKAKEADEGGPSGKEEKTPQGARAEAGGEGAEGAAGGAKTGDAPAEAGVQPGGAETPLPSLDFSTFIFSLSSSVLMHLGVVENPVTKKKEKEPAVAKQTIDLITLLKEKTAGNLTEQEAKLLHDILHELHLWYVKETG